MSMKTILLFLVCLVCLEQLAAQNAHMLSGQLTDSGTGQGIAKATVHLLKSGVHVITDNEGRFQLTVTDWADSVSFTAMGFQPIIIPINLYKDRPLSLVMKRQSALLKEVVIGGKGKPARSFMERVIAKKDSNNHGLLQHYSWQQYTRHEIDLDNVDFDKKRHGGILDQFIKIYASVDSNAKKDGSVPMYFTEKSSSRFHDKGLAGDQEHVSAYKTPGLPTDKLLAKLDKFYFQFNIYEDWVAIFDQTFASPLNKSGFTYYRYVTGDTLSSPADTLLQVRFTPLHPYEHAFAGNMWINLQTLAVASVGIHFDKANNINFIQDIRYTQEYAPSYDSLLDKTVYLPSSITSEIYFDNGAALLGIPVRETPGAIKLVARNTSTLTHYAFGDIPEPLPAEQPGARNPALSLHEQLIYAFNDSLQSNKSFQRKINMVAFAGTGYLTIRDQFRIGPYYSFISHHPVEGWRVRLGLETLRGINDKIGLSTYIAYGNHDHIWKGMVSLKYVWDRERWTRTRILYGRDYDYKMEQEDEQDADNFINSIFRKRRAFYKIFVRQFQVVHDQWISNTLSAQAKFSLKTLDPVFGFTYRPINPVLDKPYDSVFSKQLPVAEIGFGLRYAIGEQNKVIDYDQLHLNSRKPVIFAHYTYGFETGKAQFVYHTVSAGIEQKLVLPPKAQLYYRLEAGKVIGMLPYLLLHVPAGNEYYVSNRYLYNTMRPYEFAADSWLGLHSRLSLGGSLLDKIPGLRKLGWRERFAFNAFYGSLSSQNAEYNKASGIRQANHGPFMEAGVGIENIFHLLSIEYFRRISYTNLPYAASGGFYFGMRLAL